MTGVAVMLAGCVNPDGCQNNTGSGILTGGGVWALTGAAIGGEAPRRTGCADRRGGGRGGRRTDRQFDGSGTAGAVAGAGAADLRADGPRPAVEPRGCEIAGQRRHQRRRHHQPDRGHAHGLRLSAADIIDLRDAGVTDKVVNYMINTPNTVGVRRSRWW